MGRDFNRMAKEICMGKRLARILKKKKKTNYRYIEKNLNRTKEIVFLTEIVPELLLVIILNKTKGSTRNRKTGKDMSF